MLHIESIPLVPIGTVVGAAVGTVLTQTATAAAEPTSNLLLIAVVAGGFSLLGIIGQSFITAHFQRKTALDVALATAHAADAAAAAKAAVAKTDEVAAQNVVMSGQLDGKLTELLRLSRAEAKAEGILEERDRGDAKAVEVAAQGRADAVTVRTEAKEDRQEVRDAAAAADVPAKGEIASGKANDPVAMVIVNEKPVPVIETPNPKDAL